MTSTTLRAIIVVLGLAACGSAGTEKPAEPISNTPADIATATFADSLGIDLSQFQHDSTGLYWRDLTVGDGPVVNKGDTIDAYYDGQFPDGSHFETSPLGSPLTSPIGVGGLITGWDQGIPGMHVGGKRMLIIPPSLGYGPMGSPPKIPGNATLIFTIEVLAVH